MRITGKTRIMFILADPVAHIVGTDVFNVAFEGMGLDVACSALHVSPQALPEIVELNIGHFLIGEAVFVGLDSAIRMMRDAMDRGRRKGRAA